MRRLQLCGLVSGWVRGGLRVRAYEQDCSMESNLDLRPGGYAYLGESVIQESPTVSFPPDRLYSEHGVHQYIYIEILSES